MIRSSFSVRTLFPILLSFFLVGMIVLAIKESIADPSLPVLTVYAILIIVSLLTLIWCVFGELRNKVVAISLDEYEIRCKSFVGFGAEMRYPLTDFDCYLTSMLPSEYKDYEYTYLMRDGKKMVILSSFYHSNYQEMKDLLSQHVACSGMKIFKLKNEIKDILR